MGYFSKIFLHFKPDIYLYNSINDSVNKVCMKYIENTIEMEYGYQHGDMYIYFP